MNYWRCQQCGATLDDQGRCHLCAPSVLPPVTGSASLRDLTAHLLELRLNQPRVTLAEAQAQARRVMAAKGKTQNAKLTDAGPRTPDVS